MTSCEAGTVAVGTPKSTSMLGWRIHAKTVAGMEHRGPDCNLPVRNDSQSHESALAPFRKAFKPRASLHFSFPLQARHAPSLSLLTRHATC
eukprot:2394906-Amphidinium_carterae.2